MSFTTNNDGAPIEGRVFTGKVEVLITIQEDGPRYWADIDTSFRLKDGQEVTDDMRCLLLLDASLALRNSAEEHSPASLLSYPGASWPAGRSVPASSRLDAPAAAEDHRDPAGSPGRGGAPSRGAGDHEALAG